MSTKESASTSALTVQDQPAGKVARRSTPRSRRGKNDKVSTAKKAQRIESKSVKPNSVSGGGESDALTIATENAYISGLNMTTAIGNAKKQGLIDGMRKQNTECFNLLAQLSDLDTDYTIGMIEQGGNLHLVGDGDYWEDGKEFTDDMDELGGDQDGGDQDGDEIPDQFDPYQNAVDDDSEEDENQGVDQ